VFVLVMIVPARYWGAMRALALAGFALILLFPGAVLRLPMTAGFVAACHVVRQYAPYSYLVTGVAAFSIFAIFVARRSRTG